MSRNELISPEGLRLDGRRANELRRHTAKLGPLSQADGSAFLQHGHTKALAAVYGPREPRHRAHAMHDRAYLNIEFNIAPFATGERKKRNKSDKRLLEMAHFVKQTFEPVIMTRLYPRSQIDLYIQILQDDGGALHAAINASTLALIHAGIPMKDYVCAVSVCCYKDASLLDLNRMEENTEHADLTVAVLPKSGDISLLQMESRLHADKLSDLMDLSIAGCRQIWKTLDGVVRENGEEEQQKASEVSMVLEK
ncbi:ribosomal protein S5 domain 2-type protein [Piptocephalis cylindrospora]|uniref:Ribosomal RNA-processing protein 41 n=1 Tax=Piptocephalis cylindrospora TaxID=1907219 RepID=A0A4P9Y8D6_9FUNG|nr:ribosomal protein S5 domain 2-type protein [Piptocephalis cylindrospora]|eukprot:RKP15343.1 ribosomal protein S5 domain 2-type protein [Piptocephalis cylindrospora]